jgi:hypothetical protein
MSFINSVKNMFQPIPKAAAVVVTSGADYAELPQGWFRVETASGRKSLGYNCPLFLCWDCGTTVVVGKNRVTLDKPKAELPLVRLDFRRQQQGVVRVGGRTIIESESLGDTDGTVAWDGATPRDGVDYI